MPRKATSAAHDAYRHITAALKAAIAFVPSGRAQPLMQQWIASAGLTPHRSARLADMAAEAAMLAADLLLSQPSPLGGTAVGRLARSRAGAPPAEAAAIAALGQARFRLLRLEADGRAPELAVCDVLSRQTLRLFGPELPPLPAGTLLFGRVVMLTEGVGCMPGAITPLDEAAFAVARGHGSAGATSASGGARWAEAVYAHVIRRGTLGVPGLNRPVGSAARDDRAPEGGPLFALGRDWAALAGAEPDAALVQRTRQLATVPMMLDALAAAAAARGGGAASVATGFERLLLVQMETVLRRERSGSATLSLDTVGQAVEAQVAAGQLPGSARALFTALRQRLVGAAGSGRQADDPGLERLLQRIQGLRAKTVAHGCTEQEALAAAEKVAELLDRYGLSLGELDFRAQPCDGVGIQTDRRRMAPIDDCIPAVAAFFDCRVWLENAKGAPLRYVFFGLRGDVAAAQYLYELVERAFDTETAAFRGSDLYEDMEGARRSASHSFQVGLARGICGKLHALRATREASNQSASGRDLVPVKQAMVDEELAKLGLDLRSRATNGQRRVLSEAYRAGQAAGERFEVTAGITRAA